MSSKDNPSFIQAVKKTELSRSTVVAGVVLLFAVIAFVYSLQSDFDVKVNVLEILKKYPSESSAKCPYNFQIYQLSHKNLVYSLHIENNLDGEQELRFCRKRILSGDSSDQKEENELERNYVSNIHSSRHGRTIRKSCESYQYKVDKKDGKGIINKQLEADEVDKSKWYYEEATGNLKGSKPYNKLNILLGNLGCGLGNHTDRDSYSSDFGVSAKTDKCCVAHDTCAPKIKLFHSYYNQEHTDVPRLAYCACDVELYNCLRQQYNTVSDEIANNIFNKLSMKCFEFEQKDACAWKLFGYCLHYEKQCVALMKDNLPY